MYTYNHRFSSFEESLGHGSNGTSASNKRPGSVLDRWPSVVECVYSWRTGRGAQSDLSSVSPSERRDGFGIVTPRQGGNLVTRLADRKRYYEEVQRAAFPAETATGSLSTDRVSRVDSGHVFTSVKTVAFPLKARGHWTYTYNTYDGQVYGPLISPYNASGRIMSIPTTSYSITSSTERQNMFNGVFKDITPNRPDGSIFVALMELLRGDIPHFIGNLQRFTSVSGRSIKDYKDAAKAVGGEYLNTVFGWAPLVRELQGIINVLITIDRMVYAESYRRKRVWNGPSSSSERAVTQLITGGSPKSYPGHETKQLTSQGIAPFLLVAECTEFLTLGENYHLSSRLSALARPTSKTIGFAEKAEEILQRLGFVTSLAEVWELVPYSWLIDWVSNIGASIHNANVYSPTTGKYTLDYAYVSTHSTRSVMHSVRSATMNNKSSDDTFVFERAASFFSSVTKSRDRATPFGFGTQLGSLSTSQFAILVALGLAKVR